MSFNNIHIIVILVIVIIVSFIYNYDIHVTPKGEKLCEDVLIDKKNIKNVEKQNEIKIIDIKKNGVIDNVMKVLENIPTDIDQDNIQLIVSKINSIYQSSNDITEFNMRISELPNDYPYNTKYSKLVINLINKFDSELNNNLKTNKNIEKENNNSLKKSKRKNKKVSFNDNNNTLHSIEIPVETPKKQETFNNIGEFTNYAPF